MKQVEGDIWELWSTGNWIGVTTNGCIRKDGLAVMGRGIAKDAADRFPKLPQQLAWKLKNYGNHVFFFLPYRIFTFPTKNDWKDPSDLSLIRQSCEELRMISAGRVFLPRPGCSNGKLAWDEVEPILSEVLAEDWFTVVSLP